MTSTARPRRPRARLSRAALVAGATELAGSEGLDAVTIRRLAQRHGVTAMAIYAHFDGKEALLDAVGEALLDSVRLPDATEGDGRDGLTAALTALATALRAHPSIAPIAAHRVLECESGLDLAEHLLKRLTELGHPSDLAAVTSHYLLNGVIALVSSEPGRGCAPNDPAARDQQIRTRRARLLALDPARHPHVIASATPLTSCADPDGYYTHGIRLLVDGACALTP
ncbi:TetR/AcrR family transcriptional regulator [Streptomyces poriticola]|uniref:TetR/AcrR family transcriptional regulator n=1 Tax=Streptomyces poriticola TaxID=3120506 RepID=UPI002FCE14E6